MVTFADFNHGPKFQLTDTYLRIGMDFDVNPFFGPLCIQVWPVGVGKKWLIWPQMEALMLDE